MFLVQLSPDIWINPESVDIVMTQVSSPDSPMTAVYTRGSDEPVLVSSPASTVAHALGWQS